MENESNGYPRSYEKPDGGVTLCVSEQVEVSFPAEQRDRVADLVRPADSRKVGFSRAAIRKLLEYEGYPLFDDQLDKIMVDFELREDRWTTPVRDLLLEMARKFYTCCMRCIRFSDDSETETCKVCASSHSSSRPYPCFEPAGDTDAQV